MSADKVICASCGELTSPQLTHCEWCFLELTIAVAGPVETQATITEKSIDSGRPAPVSPGRIAWTFSVTAGRVPVQPLRNCPAVDGGGRVVAAVQDELVALRESEDGGVIVDWRLPTGGFIPGSPTLGRDGVIRVHSLSGNVYGVRADGQLAWEPVRIGEPLGWATPLVDDDGNTWISAYAGGLVRVDPQGKTASRQFFNCAAKLDCTGVIDGKTLYIGADDHCVHAIDLSQSRGSRRWDPSAGRGRTGWYTNSPLLLIDGPLVVAASRDKNLYAFDQNGDEVWKIPLPGQVLGSPVASAGRLYIGAASGDDDRRTGCLICLDARTRQVVWTCDTAAPIESTPVLGDDGTVYFGDNAGIVHAIDVHGKPVWTESVSSPVRSAGSLLSGRVIFGLDDGSLAALRCDSTALAAGWPKQLGSAQNDGKRATGATGPPA